MKGQNSRQNFDMICKAPKGVFEISSPLFADFLGEVGGIFIQQSSREIWSEFPPREGGALAKFPGKIPALVGAARSAGDRHA